MLTDNAAGVTLASNANMTATSAVVGQCCVPDAATVVASLPSKLIHCVDEQRDFERLHVEDFARWFDRLVVTPSFVASVDRWT